MFRSLISLAGLAASLVQAAQPNILFVFTDDQDIELGSMEYLNSVSSRIQSEGEDLYAVPSPHGNSDQPDFATYTSAQVLPSIITMQPSPYAVPHARPCCVASTLTTRESSILTPPSLCLENCPGDPHFGLRSAKQANTRSQQYHLREITGWELFQISSLGRGCQQSSSLSESSRV